jgi:DNA-binding response OmpR family regulator
MSPKVNIIDSRDPQQFRGPTHIQPGSAAIVAEDDAAFRFLLGEALIDEGFEVFSAANGTEALELYRKNTQNVSLAIVDITLPGMDGLTAATEMRKIDDNIFFLFISGYDRERLKEIGINMEDIPNSDFLWKPFAFKDMIRRIRMSGMLRQT